jgi:hypothetical protein
LRQENFVIGTVIAEAARMRETTSRTEVRLGRALAACRYPIVAWHCFSIKWRVVTLSMYAAAGYVATLAVLFALK